jgi:filamentous hemagglutinin
VTVTATVNNYLSHQERVTYNKADKACKTSGQQCDTAAALAYKDELSDRLLANAVVTCEGADCNEVSNFIQQQMAHLGCTAPSACPDSGTLNDYWTAAWAKAQGLESVFPETWLLDAKAVLDLGKLGIRLATTGGTSGLNALQALTKIDSQTYGRGIAAWLQEPVDGAKLGQQ